MQALLFKFKTLFVPQIYNQTASSSSVTVGPPFLFSSLSEVTTTILGLKVREEIRG